MTESEAYLLALQDQIGQAVAVGRLKREQAEFYLGFCSRVKASLKMTDAEKLRKYKIAASAVGASIEAKYLNNPLVILKDTLIKSGEDLTELGEDITGRVGDIYKALFGILEFLTRPVILIILVLLILGIYFHKPIVGYVRGFVKDVK